MQTYLQPKPAPSRCYNESERASYHLVRGIETADSEGVTLALHSFKADPDAPSPDDPMKRAPLMITMELLCVTSPCSCLHRNAWCCAAGALEKTVLSLLHAGAHPQYCSDRHGQTVLHMAVGISNARVCNALLAHGAAADIAARDASGCTPVWYAARQGDSEIVKLLMESRALCTKVPAEYLPATAAAVLQADKRGNTALHALASCSNGAEQHAAIAYLLLHNSDARLLRARNKAGDTAFDVALNTANAGVISAVQAWRSTQAEVCWQDSYLDQFELSLPTTPTGAQLANQWDWDEALLQIAESSSCKAVSGAIPTEQQQQQQQQESSTIDAELTPPTTPTGRARALLKRLLTPKVWPVGELHTG